LIVLLQNWGLLDCEGSGNGCNPSTIEMMIATTLWIATMTIVALIQTVAIAPLEQAKIVDKETVRAMR